MSRRQSHIVTGSLLVACLLVSGALTVSLADGTYEISWFTLGPGGGELSGGDYTLAGTAGQPDAGALSGGGYTLIGGFCSGSEALSFRYLPVIMRR